MKAKKLLAGLAACALCLSVMTACDSEKKKAETTVAATAAKTESKEETTTKPADESSKAESDAADAQPMTLKQTGSLISNRKKGRK